MPAALRSIMSTGSLEEYVGLRKGFKICVSGGERHVKEPAGWKIEREAAEDELPPGRSARFC